MKRPNKWASLIIWLAPPSNIKNKLLRLLGNTIGDGVVIGPNLVVDCGPFSIGDGSIISPFNIFRRMARVELGPKCFMGRMNQITAAKSYQKFSDRAGVLSLAEQAGITNRHYLDCSGRIELEPWSAVGGIRSILQSHEIDIVNDETTVGVIVIGERSLTATACVLLKGARVPPFSLIAAGSLVRAARPDDVEKPGLYAGSPARWRREMPECKWWHRDSYATPVRGVKDL